MTDIGHHKKEDRGAAIRKLRQLGISKRNIADWFGLSLTELEPHIADITPGDGGFAAAWQRFCALKAKRLQQGVCSSLDYLMMGILARYLHIDALIDSVEQMFLLLRQLATVPAAPEEIGYVNLLQKIFEKEDSVLNVRRNQRAAAEQYILQHSPSEPRTLGAIKDAIRQAVVEECRCYGRPVWPQDAAAMIQGILFSEKILTEREADIINRRFGLEDGKVQTFEKIAQQLGNSRTRVEQLEKKALEKLRRSSRRDLLRSFCMTFGDAAQVMNSLQKRNEELRAIEAHLRKQTRELKAAARASGGLLHVGPDPILLLSVERLSLPIKPRNCLDRSKILLIGQLVQYSEARLLTLPNLGRGCLKEIAAALTTYDLTLEMELPTEMQEKIAALGKSA